MEILTTGTRVEHHRYGEGIISKVGLTAYEIFFAHGGKVDILKRNDDLKVISKNEDAVSINVDHNELAKAISSVLDRFGFSPSDSVMAPKWVGGNLIMQPGSVDLQGKEVPIEVFFHKIVMVRDKLRVLEQNINAHEKLTDEEKVHLQQYITKAYGSLTTFNVLFSEKEDYFVGAKK
jgi:hypothetical protein